MFALGTALRETGQALDRVGCSMQGSSAFRELISKHKTVRAVYDKTPALPSDGFIAPSASVMGDVVIGERSSVWYGAVLRGDVNRIRVGADTNIQDNAVVHVATTNVGGVAMPTIIGDRVTIGHNAILHACVVKDDAFVGMGATLMDGATVEKGAMVAAGALVTPGVTIPSGELWAGAPARFMRAMTAEEKAFTATSAATYAEVGGVHAAECGKSHEEIEHDRAARASTARARRRLRLAHGHLPGPGQGAGLKTTGLCFVCLCARAVCVCVRACVRRRGSERRRYSSRDDDVRVMRGMTNVHRVVSFSLLERFEYASSNTRRHSAAAGF